MKTYKPTSQGRRQLCLSSHDQLTKVIVDKKGNKERVRPINSLLSKKVSTNGRNNLGRITCRHKGGAHKRQLREVDMFRSQPVQRTESEKKVHYRNESARLGVPGKVHAIEYDPNRTSYIASVYYVDGFKGYIIAPKGLNRGDTVVSVCLETTKPEEISNFLSVGNCLPIKAIPVGTKIHNIEIYPGRRAQMVRSAGSSADLVGREGADISIVRLPSGEMRKVNGECRATIGEVSNSENMLRNEGKAGRNRWKGIRPTVRGTVMNPIDHPKGGGEGRNKGGTAISPWGTHSKGYKTRHKNRAAFREKYILSERKKKGK